MATYFASDGSYGWANELVIIDTSEWTESDWDRIENSTDSERVDIAREIAAGVLYE